MRPKLYSKQAIAILTLLLSPLLGSILFSYNLKEVGRNKMIPAFILGGIVWMCVFRTLTVDFIKNPFAQLLFANTLYSLILSLTWDTLFKDYTDYEKKSVLRPVVVFVCICFGFIFLQLLTAKR